MTLDCEHYDNDEIMAQLGRQVVDQYIAQAEKDPSVLHDIPGPVGYIINAIAQYVDEVDEARNDCGDCRYHHYDGNLCRCLNEMEIHNEYCRHFAGQAATSYTETCREFHEKCPACGLKNCICVPVDVFHFRFNNSEEE